ncbi:MAG: hypothetical protein CL811_06075 [Colwelliaceae bacterium]|nr:hypothetical protein [Colwelliaceae bacterium]
MFMLKRLCPNCDKEIPIRKRLTFITSEFIRCEKCSNVLQPTLMWGVITITLISPITYFLVYDNIKSIWGSNVATLVVIVLILLSNRLLEPLADLKAHDENELI